MTKTNYIMMTALLLCGMGAHATTIYSENFSSPSKQSNSGANGYLGTGGVGFNYNDKFGTWLYNNGNMGIDNPAEGDGSGSSNGNAISSIDHARTQDERGSNARALSVIFVGGLFTDGVEYTVSFDVYGDASGNNAGRYWLAEVYGYDNSGANYIQIDGTQGGWGGGAKPFTQAGTATVNYLKDSASNGVLIGGEDSAGTNSVSFTFTYDASNSPDIGFAVGTYKNIFGIDNVLITDNTGPVDPPPVDPPPVNTNTNFIVVVTDDQRWDATGFMQDRMASLGRTARFPWFSGHTPGMDRLSEEGIHFDNAFCVYSLCSPSRATMLTGRYPHHTGIVDNATPFTDEHETYATLLQTAGYRTGYFGKWHMGEQTDRPGFDEVVTFYGQGQYFGTTFYDENGTADTTYSGWIDDVSTSHVLDFITEQAYSNRAFCAFLGFKTPHDKRIDGNVPGRVAGLFDSEDAVSVPNLGIDPPFGGGGGTQGDENTENYMELLAGADWNVVRLLDRLDELNLSTNTVVIFLSDNGYFRAEHRLGDKRAAYEESIRIPFMIRYPALQAVSNAVDHTVLNLDLAPTILDLAGVPIPDTMQGRSLKPLIEGQNPPGWRDSFLYTYSLDFAYPDKVPSMIAFRDDSGYKLINYPADSNWNELFNTATNVDQYEISNLYNSNAFTSVRADMQARLNQAAAEFGFLSASNVQWNGDHLELDVQAGNGYQFKVQSSTNLQDWITMDQFEGSGLPSTIDLVPETPSAWDVTVTGSTADYVLNEGPPVTATTGNTTLRCGINSGDGKAAVLVFELPGIGTNKLALARFEVTVQRQFVKYWDGDLWALGITNSTSPILNYHESSFDDSDAVRLQDAFLNFWLAGGTNGVYGTARSSLASGLSTYLRDFYEANPGYSGGQYLHLRINSSINVELNQYYLIKSAETAIADEKPKLLLKYRNGTGPESLFHRVIFSEYPKP
jgi:arylsulfatase A-like enzyme